ncbi:MAG: carbohydrate ABC transporter substrate-binding protein [Acidimicrobiaceae bacterium]|nr:carbohydrate ABC transporter substrate-binding protein [Acidimicrobiaceae bacterium]MXZ99243.1 carbohydrate ABC transporter substrate-binding protein [Acidimicrobiaceae bacterium]MYE97760.1 carbohydrate ABC transporter substrate-binding protein [Acidimicrobiaceae bacterium]MYI54952.1 carbohydrate ABC transporter substrate-binding protein [Acidimicrobiaceae bacterium]MYJ42787.1 carbohydrate ABC transporter substrate-binding protein [Acidimicrobiaceae bacterium]
MDRRHESPGGKRRLWLLLAAVVAVFTMVAAACGDDDDDGSAAAPATTAAPEAPAADDEPEAAATTAAPEAPAADDEPEPEEMAMADGSGASFVSTQFVPVEEAEKLRSILAPGDIDFTGAEAGPTIDQILAGAGAIDVLGALHGTFPPLANEDALTNMIDVLDDLSEDRSFAPSFVESGLLGSDDFLAYVPWAQATYIMAANKQALEYLPAGADIDNLAWEDLAAWCQAIMDGEGRPLCGLPNAGLFHRFLEGYLWPSFTGGMVSEFRSAEAADMLAWARDSLWPTIDPESINYEFMQEPLLAGEVWVAFDHVARLIDAFSTEPDTFVAFPTPSGPAGRGFMPVIVGLGIPADAPNPDEGVAVIEYLTRPDIQGQVLADLAFFPVVEGVDTSSLPSGVALEAEAVEKLANAPDALAALLPVGLGERGGEINQIFRNAFDRVVFEGADIATVLKEEGDALQALLNETGAPCWAPDPAGDGPCVVNPAG